MKNLLDYFYQVLYKGSQYTAVLLATPLSCCSQILLTFAILNNSTFARIALFSNQVMAKDSYDFVLEYPGASIYLLQ